MTIDAVILWVDGNDPAHKAKLVKYATTGQTKRYDVAGGTRYASLGEVFFLVASINRFAPFFHKIFIITDGQDPGLDAFLEKNFPHGHIPYEIVDHKIVFRGYEQYLPVFNSRSIETIKWRIPGLSEHFVSFNDDFMLSAPVTPRDFFTEEGNPVCYARKMPLWWGKTLRALKPRHNGHKNVSFKESMMHSAELLGHKGWFLRFEHTPRALLRSWYEDYFTAHPEQFERNISFRFRDASQFNPEELEYLPLYKEGRLEVQDPFKKLFFIQVKNKPGYVPRKLKALREAKPRFCCFNSLDQASEQDRQLVLDYIFETLQLKLDYDNHFTDFVQAETQIYT